MVPGSQYIGAYVDAVEDRDASVYRKVEKWAEGVINLEIVTNWNPRTAYYVLGMLLQLEWQYLQKIVLGFGSLMEPIESALREDFSSGLFRVDEVDDDLRELLENDVK